MFRNGANYCKVTVLLSNRKITMETCEIEYEIHNKFSNFFINNLPVRERDEELANSLTVFTARLKGEEIMLEESLVVTVQSELLQSELLSRVFVRCLLSEPSNFSDTAI